VNFYNLLTTWWNVTTLVKTWWNFKTQWKIGEKLLLTNLQGWHK
jgi:hypothetical protein